jgi:hypothetical protein
MVQNVYRHKKRKATFKGIRHGFIRQGKDQANSRRSWHKDDERSTDKVERRCSSHDRHRTVILHLFWDIYIHLRVSFTEPFFQVDTWKHGNTGHRGFSLLQHSSLASCLIFTHAYKSFITLSLIGGAEIYNRVGIYPPRDRPSAGPLTHTAYQHAHPSMLPRRAGHLHRCTQGPLPYCLRWTEEKDGCIAGPHTASYSAQLRVTTPRCTVLLNVST